jgi:hypothetical protein
MGGAANTLGAQQATEVDLWLDAPFNPVHRNAPLQYKHKGRLDVLQLLLGPGAPGAHAPIGTHVALSSASVVHKMKYDSSADKATVKAHTYAVKLAEVLATPDGAQYLAANRVFHIINFDEAATIVSPRAVVDTHDIGGIIAAGKKAQFVGLLSYPALGANIAGIGPEVVDVAQV